MREGAGVNYYQGKHPFNANVSEEAGLGSLPSQARQDPHIKSVRNKDEIMMDVNLIGEDSSQKIPAFPGECICQVHFGLAITKLFSKEEKLLLREMLTIIQFVAAVVIFECPLQSDIGW